MPCMHCPIYYPQIWGRYIINHMIQIEMLSNQLKFTLLGTAVIQTQVCLMSNAKFLLSHHATENPSVCKHSFNSVWTQVNIDLFNSLATQKFSLTQLYLDHPDDANVIALQTRWPIQNSIWLPTALKRQLSSGVWTGSERKRTISLPLPLLLFSSPFGRGII